MVLELSFFMHIYIYNGISTFVLTCRFTANLWVLFLWSIFYESAVASFYMAYSCKQVYCITIYKISSFLSFCDEHSPLDVTSVCWLT